MERYIFGAKENEKRAIKIHSIEQLRDSNGELLSVRHRDGEKTKIMIAKIMVVITDDEGKFMGIPNGNLAFELPENMQGMDEEKAFELVKQYIKEKEVKEGKDVYYLGILHGGEEGYTLDRPVGNTVEKAVEKRFKEIKKEEKLADEERKEQAEFLERQRQKEFKEKLRVKVEREKSEREERIANPSIRLNEIYSKEDEKSYISGEMTDVRTGDFLRLRKFESLKGGEYSGYIDRVPTEDAVEILNPEEGGWFKKINFKISGMTLMELAKEGDTEKIRALSEYVSKLLDKEIEKESKTQGDIR